MNGQYFSRNGQLLPISDALISVENISYQYGFGVYETIKIRNKTLYFLQQHVERLLQSAKLVYLDHNFTAKQIKVYIHELIKKNNVTSCNIKILLIGGKITSDNFLFILTSSPLFPDKKLYLYGTAISTVSFERFLPNAKTLNMLPSYLFYAEANKQKHYDKLLIDRYGNILEGTRTNVFVIQGNILITPPKDTVLNGITRQTVIAVAKKNGFAVKEEKIPLFSLDDFDGAFLTSTSSKIIPIIQVDNFKFLEISSELKKLMRIYDEFLKTSKGIFVK